MLQSESQLSLLVMLGVVDIYLDCSAGHNKLRSQFKGPNPHSCPKTIQYIMHLSIVEELFPLRRAVTPLYRESEVDTTVKVAAATRYGG